MGIIRETAKIISKYPPLYNFVIKIISKVPVLNDYFIKSSDRFAHKFPVSIKGVIIRNNSVVLLKNERDEWELPGGKLEPAETPETCVIREVHEELKLEVTMPALLDVWMYSSTLIVTFGCTETFSRDVKISSEHKQVAWFPVIGIADLNMPDGYKNSIYRWSRVVGKKVTSAPATTTS
jgi:8-oxo-dGTP pyrophosphatase MutT (NUDIX family)